MKHTHPLEIPEIADMVAPYLGGADLASCVLVSKAWHDMFLSHRWRVIQAGFKWKQALGRHVHFGPDRDSIYNHRHLIQDLSLVNKFDGLDEFIYPEVRRFEVDMSDPLAFGSCITMDFTMLTPLLVELKLVRVYTNLAFWETLSQHPQLRAVTLLVQVETDATSGFWKTCMNLESLEMHGIEIEDEDRPRNVVFDRMRKLTLTGTWMEDAYKLDLILQSPVLDSLDWEIYHLADIKEQSRNRHWPHLSKLTIRSDGHQEEDLAYILEAVGNGLGGLVEFGFYGTMEAQSSKALSLHFSTLVKVELLYSGDTSIAPVILCSCPRLEVLRVDYIHVHEIEEHGPWVCQQLRELEIWFQFVDPALLDQHPLVFERLSTLARLEHLKMKYHKLYFWDEDGLCFRVGHGLERLTSLQQLKVLDFGRHTGGIPCPELDAEAVAWMLENWRRLKGVYGRLNSDKKVEATLKEMLESHGIDTTDCRQ